MNQLLVRGGTVVTMDKERRIIKDGAVAVQGNRILAVGRTEDIARQYHCDTVIDANGMAVLPGFVNTHHHGNQTLLRGLGERFHLMDRLTKIIWPFEGGLTPQEAYVSTALGCIELIKAGVTCCNTMEAGDNANESFKAITDAGIRAEAGQAISDRPDAVPESLQVNPEHAIRENEKLIKSWNGAADGRIRYRVCPRSAFSCSEELLSGLAQLARHYDIGVHSHADEDWAPLQALLKRTGLPDIEYFHSLELTGRKSTMAHCIFVSDKEAKIMHETRTSAAYAPLNPAKSGNGIARISWLIKCGVQVGLASDTAGSNTNLDMFEEMRVAGAIQRGTTLDPTALSTEKLLELGTIDGAKALALDDSIGSIEAGKKADMILIDLRKPHLTPVGKRLVSHLVWSAYASDVDSVIIDGKLVMEHRHLKTLDESDIVDKANKLSEGILKRLGIEEAPVWPWIE